MKKCNRLQLITITITITPCLVIGLLQDHFHIEAHIGPGQHGPRLRLRPISVSLF